MAPENGHDDGEGNRNTVFIDTSLETHLVTIISDSNTVSDLKRKIVLEHRQCFPATGDIKIHCLKVKRRGNYYHLADSMLVKSAFGDTKKNWFLSVDASPLDQCEGIQHNKPGDQHQHQHQLALPWVNDSLSIDKHDNHVEDRPSKQLSLIHGSSSKHHPPKIVPFVNQKAPSLDLDQLTSDDSCKKVSKNVEEDRSSNLEPDLEQQQQQLDSKVEDKLCSVVNEEMISKKRTSDVHNEEDTCVKKRRKTQRTQGDVKGSEQVTRVLTDDIDVVKDMGTSMNDENSIEDKSKTKNTALDGVVTTKSLNEEHTGTMLVSQKKPKRSKKVKKSASAHDQVATVVVPSTVEDVGDETRSQTNTKASENMAADVAVVLEKNNIQQEAPFQSSQKEEIGNELVEEADIENEIPSSSMKGVTAEDVKHADDLVVDKSSTVFDEKVIDEQKNDKTGDEKSEGLEKTLIHDSLLFDNKGDDDLIGKEVKVAEPTESHRSRVHKEKSRKEIKGNRIKKKDVGKSSKEDEIMKHSNDAATGTNEDNLLPPPSERKESLETTSVDALHVDKDVDFSKTEMKPSQQNAEIPEEKQNENMNDTKKKRKKRKGKKSAAGNEGEEPLTKHEKIADVGTTDSGKNISKDAQKISDEGLVEKPPKKNHNSLTSKLELESSVKSNKTPEEKVTVAVSQVPKGNDVISNEIDFMEYFSPTQQPPNKTAAAPDNVENGKDTKLSVVREKKPRKKSKEQQDDKAIQSLPRNENNKELLISKKVPEASTSSRVGVKDQNINEMKTPPKTTKQIDANKPQPQPSPESESFGRSFKSQKITKQQPTVGQNKNNVQNMKKSLLNTPGTIFGNDSDDDSSANDNGTINSDSSTRTPSRESSSSGESDSSIDSRRYAVKRKEGAGKNNINSQSRLKNISMADILRSSRRFKKARVTASQQVNDTESQPVDFVPESQHLA